jgi:hypothetical protein
MLNRIAQPTSRARSLPEGAIGSRLSAAGIALLATIALLLTLAMPNGAAAADGAGGAWPWPLLGKVITPYRNGSDRYAAGQHRGLDIAAPAGTRVRAIVDGRVSFSGTLPDGGRTVTVRSADGEYLVSNLHLSSRAVMRGARVIAGDTLGAVGTSGKRSAAEPHLHLSVRRASDHAYLDPMTLLGPPRVVKSPAKAPPAVHLTAIEPSVETAHSVHAHAYGDSSSAQSPSRLQSGASRRQHTARGSADARAREGHAARHVSRVAPPPLKTSEPARASAARVATAVPVAEAPARRVAAPGASGLNRLLLLAVAAVCLVALAMRRSPRRASGPADPAATEHSDQERPAAVADVIPLHRAS